MRQIDAEALKEAIAKIYIAYDGFNPNDLGRFAERVDELIDNAPTVEPERPHGKWTTEKHSMLIYCSVCQMGYVYDIRNTFYNFCPNCGADMRGDNNG